MFKRLCYYILFLLPFALLSYTATAQKEAAQRTADSLLTFASQSIQQDFKVTLEATHQALLIARENQLDKTVCRAYSMLGNISTYTGLYTQALEEYHWALTLASEKKWSELEAELLTSIGSVYYYEDSLPRALEYYQASLNKLTVDRQKDWPYIRNLTNIGQVHRLLGNHRLAEQYIRKALQKSDDIDHVKGICVNYQNLASLHVALNDLDSAQHYFSLARGIANKNNFSRELVYIYEGMAGVHRSKNRWQESRQLLIEALSLSKKIASNTLIKKIYQVLSLQEEKEGNFKQALYYHQRYASLNDSLNSLTQRNEQQHFYNLLEAERNLNENKLLKVNVAARENELKASQATHQKQVTVTMVSAVALVMVIGLMLFLLYHYRQNQKNHHQLQHMHAAIQTQAHELEDAYLKIRQYNLELENNIEERTRQLNQQNKQLIQYAYFNAHKVRGPLARIMGLVNLLPKADHQTEFTFILDRLNESAEELDKVVHEINDILEVKHPVTNDN